MTHSLYSPLQPSSPADVGTPQLRELPDRFLSLHVRWGMKIQEEVLQPLDRYMAFVRKKYSHLRDIFVSTETEEVIPLLYTQYPDFVYHFLRHKRHVFLDLALRNESLVRSTDFVAEFVFSMANLYVATEASGFVGSLTSNWCVMIHHLERTRGDGGYDYLSVDKGSAFSTCF